MRHTHAKASKHHQDGHTEKGIEYLEVGVVLAFWGGVFAKVLKFADTKKGPPFGEPFQTAQQSGFCLVGAIGLEPTTPTMSR